jgi:hypothetical protein
MSIFVTNVANFETETGDKILYPFGPSIFQTEVDSNFTKELIEEGRKLTIKEDDWSPKLAGNLKYGRSYHYKEDYLLKIEPYLKTYVERYFNGLYEQFGPDHTAIDRLLSIQHDRQQHRRGTVRLDTLWINFQNKHDFNPPHTHNGILSFVIYCKVPKEIFEVQADSNHKMAGQIVFDYGDPISKLSGSEFPIKPYDNLMFIFPNELKHYVPAYWVDAERISVSGNFIAI